MTAGFKIAEAYVSTVPRDQDFEANLRAIVEAASAKVEAKVGLGLSDAAPEDLRGDLDAALFLATDGLDANVGMGLRNDAVEELDADVKAGVELVEDNNKIRVKVDPKSASDAQDAGMSIGKKLAIGLGTVFGPSTLVEAATVGVPLMISAIGVAFAARSPEVQRSVGVLGADISSEMTTAVKPIVPAVQDAVSQMDALFRDEMPRLSGYFTQARPALDILTGGVTGFVRKVLPGFDAGMGKSQQSAAAFAQGLDLAGDGVAHLLEGLANGENGGAQGFVALMTLVDHVLGTVGTDIGRLADAAGPVAARLEPVLSAVAGDLAGMSTSAIITGLNLVNSILSALPVDVVRAMADATAAWYVGSKVYNIVASVGPAMVTAASKVKLLSAAEIEAAGGAEAMGAAWGKTLGVFALVGTAAAYGGEELGKLAGVGDHTAMDVDTLTSSMVDAAGGSMQAQDQIRQLTLTALGLSDAMGDKASGAMKSLDDALVKLYQTNPQQATTEFQAMSAAMQAQGLSSQQVAADLPQYTQAVNDAALADKEHASALGAVLTPAQQVTQALIGQQQQLAQQAAASSQSALAALSFADSEGSLNQQLANTIGDYTLASSAASAFKTAEDALFGKYANYSQAQATFTTDLAQATGQLTRGKDAIDLSSAAGAKNFTVLNQLASANEQVAQSLIQQGGSQDAATASLQKGAQAIDDLAKKSGFTDTQIKQLNIELYGVPTVKQITFNANTKPAVQALNNLIQRIDNSSGTVQIYGSTNGVTTAGGKALGANARGGPVQAGDVSVVGEEGIEIVQFARDGYVIPNDQIRKVGGDTAVASGSAGLTIGQLSITIPMQGFADFTDPNSMDTAARRMAVNISNALVQVQNSRAGATR
jgi:hypothetical protein